MSDPEAPENISFFVFDASDQIDATKTLLEEFGRPVTTCADFDAFPTCIAKLSAKTNSIILICSGTFGHKLKGELDKYPQIFFIIVYCQNKGTHVRWASTIEKVSTSIMFRYRFERKFDLNNWR